MRTAAARALHAGEDLRRVTVRAVDVLEVHCAEMGGRIAVGEGGPQRSVVRREGVGTGDSPAPRGPGGVYQPVVMSGRVAYVSGHGPLRADGSYICGRVGADLDVAAGRAAARQTGLAILSSLRIALGTLDRVSRVVKLLGMVQATPEFGDHPAVINGCSELYAEIWGPDRGVGARSAVGLISLPHAIAVEIEGIFEID